MDLPGSASPDEFRRPGIPCDQEPDRIMMDIQVLSGIPGAVAGLPVPVIIPTITLGFLAAIIALRLNRDRNRTMRDGGVEKYAE
jgi:hypothetical protein